MAGEKRDNSGALFINSKKEKDTHPDYFGQIMIAGKEYWLSGWKKTSQAGIKYLSLSIKPKEEQAPRKEMPDPTEGW